MFLLLLLIEFIGVLYISRILTQTLFHFFLLLFRIRAIAISLITLLFFPGTVIHELAHLFIAEILGVRTGKLSLVPESLETEKIQAGSVAIAHTGPIRRYIIGLAPIFVGIASITILSYYFGVIAIQVKSQWLSHTLGTDYSLYLFMLIAYLLFVISNSMFSSPQDLKGFIPVSLTLALIIGAGYLSGIRFGLTGQALAITSQVLNSIVTSLGYVLALNMVLLLLTKVLIDLTGKLTHRRIASP